MNALRNLQGSNQASSITSPKNEPPSRNQDEQTLGNQNDPEQPDESYNNDLRESQGSQNLEALISGNNMGLAFGTGMLLQEGVIDKETLAKISRAKVNPDNIKIITAIELNHIPVAEKIALDPQFIEDNETFVNSGEAVKVAVWKGRFAFADELIKAGYKVSPDMLYDGIKDQNEDLISNCVSKEYYDQDYKTLDFWYLIQRGWLKYAKIMYERDSTLQGYMNVNPFNEAEEAKKQLRNPAFIEKALTEALERGHDVLASVMLGMNPDVITAEMIETALKKTDLEFLKKVWTGNFALKHGVPVKKRAKKSRIWKQLDAKSTETQKYKVMKQLKLSYILEQLLKDKKIAEARRVLTWPDACNEPGIIQACVTFEQEELAKEVMARLTYGLQASDLRSAIEEGHLELGLEMLKWKDCRAALHQQDIQQMLLDLLERGESAYYAMEYLQWIPTQFWSFELTRPLCNSLAYLTKKTNQLVLSHNILMFTALAIEFVYRISDIALEDRNKCQETAEDLEKFGEIIQAKIPDEDELRYLMTQRDTRGRSVFTVVSTNRLYSLLEDEDIGTIVGKLWVGSKQHHGLMSASTIYQSLDAPAASEESLFFMKRTPRDKPYVFQYDQWTESCSLRFFAQGLSTLVLVFVYTMLVHTATEADVLDDVTQDSTSLTYLRTAQVWVSGIFIEQILHIIFGWYTKRGYLFDGWKLIDFLMFIQMIILMSDLHKSLMGEGNIIDFIEPKVYNTILHATMLIFIWLKFISVLITHKKTGPLIRMIYLMGFDLAKFIVIWLCLVFLYSGIMTAIFHDKTTNESYKTFGLSFRTLFSSSLGGLNMEVFSEQRYFGELLLAVFYLATLIILLNLLIALLSNVYEVLVDRVDSEYASILINQYTRWSWNEKYGILILLPPPLTWFTFLISPFVLMSAKPERWNILFSKLGFLLYAIPQFAFFVAGSLIGIPFLYLQGFISYGKTGTKQHEAEQSIFKDNKQLPKDPTQAVLQKLEDIEAGPDETKDEESLVVNKFSYSKAFVWIFIGLPWIFMAFFRDISDFWSLVYVDLHTLDEEDSKTRVQALMNERIVKDLQRVLKRIRKGEISVKDFYDNWVMVDDAQLNPALAEDEEALALRHQTFNEYLLQLCNNTKKSQINVNFVRMLLPRRTYYSKAYITRAVHINIPWILKGIESFHTKIGSVSVGQGVTLPKQLIKGETPELKYLDHSMKKLDIEYYNVNSGHKELATDVIKLTQELRNATETL